MPTQTKENYLKAVFSIAQKNGSVSITELAAMMEVSKPTVNSMVKKMEENNWIVYEKYKPLQLTDKGEKVAALIVRKHRLTEMFLTEIMGFGWEEVHDIAEEMEHLDSSILFDRMDQLLGFPTIDPHGSPIPDRTGKIANRQSINLSTLKKGDKAALCGVTNSSKELLVSLNKKNIKLGSEFRIKEVDSFDNSMEVILKDKTSTLLTSKICQCLLVEKI